MKASITVRGVAGGGSWILTAFGVWRHAAIKHILGEPAEHFAHRMPERMHGPKMLFSKTTGQ